jgi:cysteine desulfurase/selenocysteine lyase
MTTTEARLTATPAQPAASHLRSTSTDPIDPERLRTEFPILDQEINGHPFVYLDSASTSQKPQVVLEAMDTYYREYNANVHRGIYTIGERATAEYEKAREDGEARRGRRRARDRVRAQRHRGDQPRRLLVGRKHIGRGDVIVLTEMEHHANPSRGRSWPRRRTPTSSSSRSPTTGSCVRHARRPAQAQAQARGVHPRANTLGTINPIEDMTPGPEAGALVLIDGAQAVPHIPVDIAAIGCALRVQRPQDARADRSGALWGRRSLEAMPPFLAGGEMIHEVHLRRSDWNAIPWKFEAGTPDIAAAIGLGAAADYLRALGMGRVAAHERELVTYALDTLEREVPGIVLYGPPAELRRRSTSRASTRTTLCRCSTGMGSRSGPATTARCRSTNGSTWRDRSRLVRRVHDEGRHRRAPPGSSRWSSCSGSRLRPLRAAFGPGPCCGVAPRRLRSPSNHASRTRR